LPIPRKAERYWQSPALSGFPPEYFQKLARFEKPKNSHQQTTLATLFTAYQPQKTIEFCPFFAKPY
jgi:hypothetical protein